MTAREIYETQIICPTPIENRNENTYNSIFESYQTREIQRHKNKAKIEGESIYYPKAIEKLKYEIADEAPTLFHLWVNYGKLQDYFISEANIDSILKWIDQRLNDSGEDSISRKCAEEKYQHELFTFVNNGALIIKLEELLNAALTKDTTVEKVAIPKSTPMIDSKALQTQKNKAEEIAALNNLFFAHNESYKKHTAPFGYSWGDVLFRFIHEEGRNAKYIVAATKILYHTTFLKSTHKNKRLVWKQQYPTLRSWQKKIASICELPYTESTWKTYSKPKVVNELLDELAIIFYIDKGWIKV